MTLSCSENNTYLNKSNHISVIFLHIETEQICLHISIMRPEGYFIIS